MKFRFPIQKFNMKIDKKKMLNWGLGLIIGVMLIGIGKLAAERIFTSDLPTVPKIAAKKVVATNPKTGQAKVDIAAIYPFYIEKTTQPAPHEGQTVSKNLPAIPNYQVSPKIPSIPIPGLPPDILLPSNPKVAGVGVQGVFVGEDGKNMAILNNGTIVSEGDNYQDGRIAYIGGDGIRFEDGKTIKYK